MPVAFLEMTRCRSAGERFPHKRRPRHPKGPGSVAGWVRGWGVRRGALRSSPPINYFRAVRRKATRWLAELPKSEFSSTNDTRSNGARGHEMVQSAQGEDRIGH